MSRPTLQQRGFIVLPAIALLALVLIGLSIGFWMIAPANSGPISAYQRGKSTGAPIGGIVVAVLFFITSGRIAEKRSAALAHMICVPILGLACLAYGINLYRALNNTTPQASSTNAPTATPGAVAPSAAPAGTKPLGTSQLAKSPPTATAPQPASSQPMMPAVAPKPEQGDAVQQKPASGKRPVPAKPAPEPEPRAMWVDAANKALTEYQAEVTAQLAALRADAEKLCTMAESGTPRVRKGLEEQQTLSRAVKASATKLSQQLLRSTDEARSRVEAAGAPASESLSLAIKASHGHSTSSFACNRVGDFADRLDQEATLLLTNYPKWKLNKDKEVESTDKRLQQEARSHRFFIESDLKGKLRLLDGLTVAPK